MTGACQLAGAVEILERLATEGAKIISTDKTTLIYDEVACGSETEDLQETDLRTKLASNAEMDGRF